MIPGFVYTPVKIQDHIHLGFLKDDLTYTGLGPYNEPPYEFHVIKRMPSLDIPVSINRTWNYRPIDQIQHIDGKSIKFKNMDYELRVTPDKLAILEALAGNRVLLIDNFHCDPTEDHTPYIRFMHFSKYNPPDALEPTQQYVVLSIGFIDLDTIPVKARTI